MSGYVETVVIAGAASGVGRTAVAEAFSHQFRMCASLAGGVDSAARGFLQTKEG